MTGFSHTRLLSIGVMVLSVMVIASVVGSAFAQDATPTPILIFETPTSPPAADAQQAPISAPTITPVLVAPINVTPTVPVGADGVPLNTPLLAQEYPLAALRVRNMELLSPYGLAQFTFDKPNNWVTDGVTILYLNIEYFENVPSDIPEEFAGRRLITVVDVQVDGILVGSISLDSGSPSPQTVPVTIPNSVLSSREGSNHEVSIAMRAEDHCLSNAQARVLIRSDLSYIHFEYRERPPRLDLAEYPAALYNGTLNDQPESLIFVLPDNPSKTDLQAAASIAAGLGNLTFNDVAIQVRRVSELTDVDRQTSGLVVIGLPTQNRLISEYYADGVLPTSLNEAGRIVYEDTAVNRDDGVVQFALNPDNTLLPLMVVTGFTDAALQKAALSLAGPPPLIGISGPVALVEDARTVARAPVGVIAATDVTLTELGFPQITLNGVGAQRFDIEFRLPYDQLVASGSSLDLIYNYSTAFDKSQTSLSIWVNDNIPVTSLYLDDEVAKAESPGGPYSIEAQIPDNAFNPGDVNNVSFFLDAQPLEECNIPDALTAWFTISGDSSLHLPRRPVDLTQVQPVLAWYPTPFNSLPDLSNVWISIPEKPTSEDIQQLLRLLSQLASNTQSGEGFFPRIEFGEIPSESDLGAYHFIILGRYTTNPFLADINDNMPQPFLPDSDQLEQILDDVSYRLPAGYEIGVLEMFRSPWANDKAVMVITGTGATGQANAAAVLTEQIAGQQQLQGDVVFVNGQTVSAVDTREIEQQVELLTAIPELATEAAIEQSLTPEPTIRFTVTPGPTLTPSITNTPRPTSSPTPLFTFTPSATVPTPIPTFPPPTADEFQPVEVQTPPWVNILVMVTIGASVIGGLYALIQFIRASRRSGNR